MRRLSISVMAAVSTIVLTQIAPAADLVRKAPVYVPPVYNWTGFYVGANIGGGWGDRHVDYAANDLVSFSHFRNLGGEPPPVSINTTSVLGGLQLGYNWQMGPAWLIGAEADLDWSGVKGAASSGGAINIIGAPFANTVEEKVKWLSTVRARLGYLWTPNLLAFVTGGFAYGDVERSGSYTLIGGVTGILGPIGYACAANIPCFSGSADNRASGWTAGGGLEYAVARNWTIRGNICM